jgi:hypothetical protein
VQTAGVIQQTIFSLLRDYRSKTTRYKNHPHLSQVVIDSNRIIDDDHGRLKCGSAVWHSRRRLVKMFCKWQWRLRNL